MNLPRRQPVPDMADSAPEEILIGLGVGSSRRKLNRCASSSSYSSNSIRMRMMDDGD